MTEDPDKGKDLWDSVKKMKSSIKKSFTKLIPFAGEEKDQFNYLAESMNIVFNINMKPKPFLFLTISYKN